MTTASNPQNVQNNFLENYNLILIFPLKTLLLCTLYVNVQYTWAVLWSGVKEEPWVDLGVEARADHCFFLQLAQAFTAHRLHRNVRGLVFGGTLCFIAVEPGLEMPYPYLGACLATFKQNNKDTGDRRRPMHKDRER